MSTLKLKNINKIYPNGAQAVFDFNLEIEHGEFVVLVGPSGCGKTTTLRMISGLEPITSGKLYIDGLLANDLTPKERNIAMVFQSYALYPHMTIAENIAFSLKFRKYPIEVIEKIVADTAKMLDLTEYLEKKPRVLSGGQRQRVALGRAIARRASVFLLDEPLSNLDAKLRVQMRAELIELHNRIKSTFIYVTHDQIEAMTMADKIVVMSMGYIMQVGTPKEVYDNPNNVFVGGFMGTPPMNFLHGVASGNKFIVKDYEFLLTDNQVALLATHDYFDKPLIMGLRPEFISVATHEGVNTATFKTTNVELLGDQTNLYFNIADMPVIANIVTTKWYQKNEEIVFHFLLEKAHFFDAVTEERIR